MDREDQLRGLVEFVAAVQSGSFSGAARKLGVSVAHVSRSVRDLEAQLGIQLLHRTSRHSAPTEAGRQYFEQCRALLDGLSEARERIRIGQASISGTVRVSMNGIFAETRVAPVLSRFALENPGVTVVTEMNSRNVRLGEDEIDIAVRAGPLESSDLRSRRLATFPLITLAAPACLDREGRLPAPTDLDPALCLSLNDRIWSFRQGSMVHRLRPAGRYRSNSGALVVEGAVRGLGYAQVPAYYGEDEVRSGSLVRVFEDWTDEQQQFEFHIVYAPQRHLPVRVRSLIDRLIEELR